MRNGVLGGRAGAYGVAALLALAGLAVTALLVKPLAGPFFMFQFAAVVGAALYGGLGPGLLTMGLSAIGSFAMFFAPTLEGYEAWRLGSFAVVSVFFAWLAARMRDAKAAAEEARAKAEKAEAEAKALAAKQEHLVAVAEAAQSKAEAAEAEAKLIGTQQEYLVAVVGHDLRNPLNAITLSAQYLLLDASESQGKSLSRIVTSAHRMHSMIRDLLDYARARHGSGLPMQPQPSLLGDICRAAIEEVRTAHPKGTVLLEVTGDDAVTLDPARVEQMVCNLVTNALKHGALNTPVSVSVTQDGDGVRLEVRNQGVIQPHLMATLFDPFRAGDAAGSVGLGLFIVREIARGHGGTVSARSDELGTTFTVVFPKRLPEEDPPTGI